MAIIIAEKAIRSQDSREKTNIDNKKENTTKQSRICIISMYQIPVSKNEIQQPNLNTKSKYHKTKIEKNFVFQIYHLRKNVEPANTRIKIWKDFCRFAQLHYGPTMKENTKMYIGLFFNTDFAIFVDIRKVHKKWSIFCFYDKF